MSPPHKPETLAAAPTFDRATAALLLLAGLGLVAHSLLFNFVTDDAFISFVYSRNLAQHGQLVFNLGERVEGYTNFLWTLILAGGLVLHIPAELSSRVLGTLLGAAGLAVSTWLFSISTADGRDAQAGSRLSALWRASPALFLAAIPGYACWSSGGLETQLFTLLFTSGAALYLHAASAPAAVRARALPLASLCLGLSALTRPEGYLFFGLLSLHLLTTQLQSRRVLAARGEATPRWFFDGPQWQALGLFLLLTVPHLAFRRLYYGDWVPNTFYVKSAGGPGTWKQGGYYLFTFLRDQKLAVLPLLYVLGLLRLPSERTAREKYLRLGLVTYGLSAVFLLYVASVGGDFMGLHRFVLPIVPLQVVCGFLGLFYFLRHRPASAALGGLGLLFALHLANTFFVDRFALSFIGADRGIDTPGFLRHYAADRTAIGKWLGQHVAPDDYQVVGGAGAQVYYAGIRALDSFGLCDAYVAKKTPPLSSRPGHQKFAPLSYVLSRTPPPTILTYNVYRIAAAPYQPDAGEAAMWRSRGFHYVSVPIPGLSQPWYSFLKRIDRRLGPLPALNDGLDSP
ncbi:hypothetical protein [Haliangium sp. UPWRP_2]|uniref:hypothetical protein n=1 Tax=Haliangium sp. UPWRP_2 TaxID=1931276 RepID=UPI000B547F8D|nr:hypothetical protein [Haliangium sp. UPWRP_2]PSM32397.1 hypothetical protein BVG81_000340 [Haliangium sp. UPWRP_2]